MERLTWKFLILLCLQGICGSRSEDDYEQPRVAGLYVLTDIYYFPWSCWLNTEQIRVPFGHLKDTQAWPISLGMCSILTRKHVFGSVENLWKGTLSKPRATVKGKDSLFVFTGTNSPRDPTETDRGKEQFRPVSDLWISLGPRPDTVPRGPSGPLGPARSSWSTDDWNNTLIEWEVIGAAFNLALIEVKVAFDWDEVVLPMPIRYATISENKEKMIKVLSFLDIHPHSRAPCSIMTYGPFSKAQFTQVSYVPRETCKSVYCSVDMGYCFRFPFQWYHMCFRSVVYTEPCQYDQGAALYCNWWNRTIFGILANSDNCGIDGLPAVYYAIAAPLYVYANAIAHGDDNALHSHPFGRDDEIGKGVTFDPNVPTPTVYDYTA